MNRRTTVERLLVLLVLALALAALAACAPQAVGETPPDIRYGEDPCDRCGMIISESRYAASYVTPAGDVRLFDDIRDMLLHYEDSGEEAFIFWVHDYETMEWIKAEDAYFVQSADLVTPMGSGLAACAGREAADELAATLQGEVLTFAGVQAHVVQHPGVHGQHGGHGEHGDHQGHEHGG